MPLRPPGGSSTHCRKCKKSSIFLHEIQDRSFFLCKGRNSTTKDCFIFCRVFRFINSSRQCHVFSSYANSSYANLPFQTYLIPHAIAISRTQKHCSGNFKSNVKKRSLITIPNKKKPKIACHYHGKGFWNTSLKDRRLNFWFMHCYHLKKINRRKPYVRFGT